MRVALDTNVLAYAEGVNGADRKRAALTILRQLSDKTPMLPVQVLGELFSVLFRKAKLTPGRARAAILSWRDSFPLIPTSPSAILKAADLAAEHQFNIWDAVILSVAIEAGCRLLLSEDMQDGFTWGGTTIVNPFATLPHPLFRAILTSE